ncbi:MAG: hypothetical protein AAF481_06295 [Acidobacteriota bacterium]
MTESSTSQSPSRSRYEILRRQASAAADLGHLDEALDLCDKSWQEAKALGEPELVDRAFCNRSAVLIALNRGSEVLRDLRELLSSTSNTVNRRFAAYHIARIYEVRKDRKKALLYARISRGELSKLESPEPEWRASSHNLMGNLLIAESRFEEAAMEYENALAVQAEAPELRRAMIWGNLGYSYIALERHFAGFDLLYRSLRVFRRSQAERPLMIAHLDLCFAHLEVSRYRHAWRHGQRSLELAQSLGELDTLKNCLYLLGEAANLLGNHDEARACFDRLQSYFPDVPFLTEFLFAIDVRKMINLRA